MQSQEPVPTDENSPASLSETEQGKTEELSGAQLKKHVLGALWIGLAFFVLVEVSALLTVYSLPEGKAFVLRPRGWAVLAELGVNVLLVSAFAAFYTIPARMVRPSLGCMLRAIFFLLFGVFLSVTSMSKSLAVVRTESEFLFVRHFPLGVRHVPIRSMPEPKLVEDKRSRMLSIRFRSDDWINCKSVWRFDSKTSKILDDLYAEMKKACKSAVETRKRAPGAQ